MQQQSKSCTKCGVTKEINDFGVAKDNKDGRSTRCKACLREYSKRYEDSNREHRKKRKMYARLFGEMKNKDKEYRKAHSKEGYEYQKDYKEKNRARIKERDKIYSQSRERKKAAAAWRRDQRKNNPQFRLIGNQRGRIHNALKGYCKSTRTLELLGCDVSFLVSHLEAQFQEGMSWDNYGKHGWHVDHIIPLSAHDLTDEEQLKKACHYTNLQPLWAVDNLRKSGKIPEEYTNE